MRVDFGDLEEILATLARELNAERADPTVLDRKLSGKPVRGPDGIVPHGLEGARWRKAPALATVPSWIIRDEHGDLLARLTAPVRDEEAWTFKVWPRGASRGGGAPEE